MPGSRNQHRGSKQHAANPEYSCKDVNKYGQVIHRIINLSRSVAPLRNALISLLNLLSGVSVFVDR